MTQGRYVFDIETNGLLLQLDRIHSLCFQDIDTGQAFSCTDDAPGYMGIKEGLAILQDAELLVGHNVINFDVPAIQKLHPTWAPRGLVRDTILYSRLLWSDMFDADMAMEAKRERAGQTWVPRQHFGNHGLMSWGHRLGHNKGDYSDVKKAEGRALGLKKDDLTNFVWASWNQAMQDYCDLDVVVTAKLWAHIARKMDTLGFPDPVCHGAAPGSDFIELEHKVATIVGRQERRGFTFKAPEAEKLYAEILKLLLEEEAGLTDLFAPWFRPKGPNRGRGVWARDTEVKRTDLDVTVTERRFGKNGKELAPYVGPIKEQHYEGAPYTHVELRPFNPGSGQDIADRLKKLRGWVPVEFTKEGFPKTDEETLAQLPYPEAKRLVRHAMLKKRAGQLADGKEGLLKHVRDGRIHGGVNTLGTVTGRMSHSKPNIAQVPAGYSEYGHEFRDLFVARPGYWLLGCDADALELRDFAGYLARYDDGAYIETVLRGDKAAGTDMHSQNARALGLDPLKKYLVAGTMLGGRDIAKTWFYAFLYGAWDTKLGMTLGATGSKEAATKAGAKGRASLLAALPALDKLIKAVKAKVKSQGFLKGIDGRRLRVRSDHAALNTLLQSAGAVQMKRGLVILDEGLQAAGYVPGDDYEFVANVHDEWQIEVAERHVMELDGAKPWSPMADMAQDAIRLAGEFYSFRCPLAGNADLGRSWADTH